MGFERNMDYIDVATRLTEMREKFPELTMSQVKMEFVEVAGKSWVVYTAAAYRAPDDVQPGIGTAWEPIPGPTSFTKDSEVQNAETAAWGRALLAIGASTKNGIASHEEVTNRQGPDNQGQRPESQPRGQSVEGKQDDDPRLVAILKAEGHGNDFVDQLCGKYRQYGSLSEKQLDSGLNAAGRILGNETRVSVNEPQDYPFAPDDERF